jgi:ABC-type multidrug transport system permease subunit
MGFFGPPDELLRFFEAEDYADVFDKVTNEPDRWAQRYRNSEVYRKYVGEVALELTERDSRSVLPAAVPTPRAPEPAAELAAVPTPRPTEPTTVDAAIDVVAPIAPEPVLETPAPVPAVVAAPAAVASPPPAARAPGKGLFRDARKSKNGKAAADGSRVQDLSMTHRALHPVAPLRQFVTLCLRMVAVIISDRGYAGFLIGLPLALGALSHTVPGSKGLGPDAAGYSLEAQRILVVLVIGAAFMGVAVAIREIINESSIYRRERAIGLSPTAYLASKVVIFVAIDAIQAIIFVYIALLGRPGPADGLILANPTAEIILAIAMVAITSTALGLLASALVRTTEQTTPILVVSVMAQLVLSGGLFEISGQTGLEIASWVDPSRWGFAAAADTTELLNFPFKDSLWVHDPATWWKCFAVLIVQAVGLLLLTRLALRRYEPGKG